jgi:hypothetical protein
MVTVVFGRMAPELSETVPVTPPRVCCAGALGARGNVKQQQSRDVTKKTLRVFLLLLVIRNASSNCRDTRGRTNHPGLPKNYRFEGDVLGLAEPHGTDCKMLGTNYSYFVVFAMKFLTFADLFFFFLWKTRRAKISRIGREATRRNKTGKQAGNRAVIRAGERTATV